MVGSKSSVSGWGATADVSFRIAGINIGKGEQFTSGFVAINPNSKIPAAIDYSPKSGGKPVRLFESASIVLYLAEKYGRFMPQDPDLKTEVMNWVMVQMASQG